MYQAPIKLNCKDVPKYLKGLFGYTGRKFRLVVCTEVHIPMTAGLWSGGSREEYQVVRLADGCGIEPVNHNASPFNAGRRDTNVRLEPGIAVVRQSDFCGKNMGLTFYVHPENATPLLPREV